MSSVAAMAQAPSVPKCRYLNATPFLFAPMVWRGLEPGYTMTVVIKASFALVPGKELTPLTKQIPFRGDEWEGEDHTGGLLHGTDMAVWKPRTDVLLRGSCYHPGKKSGQQALATFSVGAWSKSLVVHGDRVWKVRLFDRTPGEAVPFAVMPLRWERALGGPDHPANPVGRGCRSELMPNLESPHEAVVKYGKRYQPACFAPINRLWPTRMAKTGTYRADYLKKRFPLPAEDFDWSYHNEAPEDQQLAGYLHGDEPVSFLNLHGDSEHWTVQLPGIRLRLFVADTDGNNVSRVREMELHCDTLYANIDEGYLHLLWRGMLPVCSEDRGEITAFYLVQEALAEKPLPAADHVRAMGSARDLGETIADQGHGEIAAAKEKADIILARYGLKMPAERSVPGLTNEELACYPFAPQGPLPASMGEATALKMQAEQLRSDAMSQLKPLGAAHGVDVDAPAAAASTDPVVLYRQGLEEGIRVAQGGGKEAPELVEQLAKLNAPGGDPFGIKSIAASFAAAGMDLASQGALGAAVASGDAAKVFAVIAAKPTPTPGQLDGKAAAAFISAGGSCASGSFSGADFSGLDLSGHDFSKAQLNGARFCGAKLVGARFAESVLSSADFTDADFSGATLGFGDYHQADFTRAKFDGASFVDAAFRNNRFVGSSMRNVAAKSASFDHCDLTDVACDGATFEQGIFQHSRLFRMRAIGGTWRLLLFSECCLDEVDVSRATLVNIQLNHCQAQRFKAVAAVLEGFRAFNGSDLQGACLMDARAADSSFMYSVLDEADFSRAQLQRANLMFSSCVKTVFRSADLKQGVFRHAKLWQADLRHANLCQATFGLADLTAAMLLETNCYQADFQDAIVRDARFDGANLVKCNLRRD